MKVAIETVVTPPSQAACESEFAEASVGKYT